MKPIVQVVRAVGAEFIRRSLRPVIMGGAVAAALLLGLGVWLVTISIWWWLFLVPAIGLSLVFAVLTAVAIIVVKVADSVQSKPQRRAVNDYVDRLQRVSENVQTPQYVILYRVVRDVIQPSPNGYIASLSRDSQALAPDFNRLVNMFR